MTPKLGDAIRTPDGLWTHVLRLPLYQPAAPGFFEVTDSAGVTRFITFRGAHWVEHGKDVPSSRHGAPGEPATRSEELRIETAGEGQFVKPGQDTSSRAAAKLGARRADHVASPETAPVERAKLVRRRRRSREGEEYTTLEVKDGALGPQVMRLHARLDEARDRYAAARESGSGERLLEAMQVYAAAITAVDAADPLFYLGRIKPMAPLVKGERVVLPKFAVAEEEEAA